VSRRPWTGARTLGAALFSTGDPFSAWRDDASGGPIRIRRNERRPFANVGLGISAPLTKRNGFGRGIASLSSSTVIVFKSLGSCGKLTCRRVRKSYTREVMGITKLPIKRGFSFSGALFSTAAHTLVPLFDACRRLDSPAAYALWQAPVCPIERSSLDGHKTSRLQNVLEVVADRARTRSFATRTTA